jgi:hypothetical protein
MQAGIIAIVAVLLLMIVPISTIAVSREGNENFHKATTSKTYNETATDDGIKVISDVVALDPFNRQMKIKFMVKGQGVYHPSKDGSSAISRPVTVEYDSNIVDYIQNEQQKTQYFLANLDGGDPNEYPFDVYYFDRYIIRAHNNGTEVPLSMKQTGTLQGWKFVFKISNGGQGSSSTLKLSIKATRSSTTYAFSILLFSVMWLLSCGAFLLTMCYITFDFLEPPLIAILGTMLFALPAVRNTQPGAPPIGCILDVAGLFWNMTLVSVCVFALMCKFIKRKFLAHAKEHSNTI